MQQKSSTQSDSTKWTELLTEAVNKPGLILEAYRAFHGYSIGNQILALVQCQLRKIQPGPIATYPSWQKLGRQVKKGEKALLLCMPLTHKRKAEDESKDDSVFTLFVYKARWFVLTQTEGEPIEVPTVPDWDRTQALNSLNIVEVPFKHLDGNCLGYAKGHEIAINPVNPMPHKTTFHEAGHILLGHTTESAMNDGEFTPRNLREVEAESVALICCESLGLPGAEFCRGYIQDWLEGDVIPEKSAQKIFHTADLILKAGRASKPETFL